MTKHSIAIDGPSGAGKTSLARQLADALGFLYLDTGAIYRAVALYVYRTGIDPHDNLSVAACLPDVSITLRHVEGAQQVYLNNENVSAEIRQPVISQYVSTVSAIQVVRDFLLDMQRELAATQNIVMDGRDIGTTVLPDAKLKIFLTATPERRAERRYLEVLAKQVDTTFDEVLTDMIKRDERDTKRTASPLRQAADAVVLDSTNLNFEETLAVLVALARTRLENEDMPQ